MNIKEKLADAHNNFPIIESHPAILYAEALDEIVSLEEKIIDMHVTVSGYLKGDEWTHWQKHNMDKFNLKSN